MRSKRTMVLGVTALGAVVLAVSVVTLFPVVLKQWHIQRLRSDDLQTRRVAALALGEMRAYDAIPVLLDELLARAPVDAEAHLGSLDTSSWMPPEPPSDVVPPIYGFSMHGAWSWPELEYTIEALDAMGDGARDMVVRIALQDERRLARYAAAQVVRLAQLREANARRSP